MERKIQILGAILILVAGKVAFSQVTFQKVYQGGISTVGNSVDQTNDGGYIMTGYTFVSATIIDVLLIKVDSSGDISWAKTYGGNIYSHGNSVRQTSDGGYIVAGWTNSFDTIGTDDIYLIKTNNFGDTIWTKIYGGLTEEITKDVRQTFDGGYIIAGYTNSFGAGGIDVFAMKTDMNGDTLWAKTYGGNNEDMGISIEQTNDSGFIIAGVTNSFGSQGDIYLIKTNSIGDTLWTKSFGSTFGEEVNSISQSPDGGYIIVGQTYSFGVGNSDVYLVKTDSAGHILWNKTYGGANYESGYSVAQTSDGDYLITGNTNSFLISNLDIFILKTDSIGNTIWCKIYGGNRSEYAYDLLQSADGGIISFGYSLSFGHANQFYLIKTDMMGNSNCFDSAVTFSESSPLINETETPSIVSHASFYYTSPPTIVGSLGIDSTLCITVGINEPSANKSFVISPNPTASQFEVRIEDIHDKNCVIEIFNTLGEKIYSEKLNSSGLLTVDCRLFPRGIYFVRQTDSEKQLSQKLILE